MESHELMRLLIPDHEVKKVAEFVGLSPSLLYQERRAFGTKLTDTGTRNTIERLDLMCEYALGKNPQVVRMIGERYLKMYENFQEDPSEVSVADLLKILGLATKECGEAMSALANRQSIKDCTIEVTQAKEVLEQALKVVVALEKQSEK